MAHFFGAVSEIRTSGLIPPWLGSSASQPVEDRKEKRRREDVGGDLSPCDALTLGRMTSSHGAGPEPGPRDPAGLGHLTQ